MNINELRQGTATVPQDKSKFEILFNGVKAGDGTLLPINTISHEIMSFGVEENKAGERSLSLTIRDTACGSSQRFIEALRDHRNVSGLTAHLQTFGPNGTSNYTVRFENVSYWARSYTFDRWASSTVMHQVTLAYGKVSVNEGNQPDSTEA